MARPVPAICPNKPRRFVRARLMKVSYAVAAWHLKARRDWLARLLIGHVCLDNRHKPYVWVLL